MPFLFLALLIIVLIICAVMSATTGSHFHSNRVRPLLVSYDFDNTLKNQYTKDPVYPIIKRMMEDKEKGIKLIICTSRFKAHTDEIKGFLKIYNLGDVPIYATGHGPKSSVLKKYVKEGYQVYHYDDQTGVLDEIVRNVPEVTGLRVLYEGVMPSTDYRDVVIRHDK